MRVEAVSISGGFLGHMSTELVLPPRGVVTVRGANGSGKSALVEGVAWGAWGETLRGEYPWPEGVKEGRVTVHADGVTMLRNLTARSPRLSWDVTGAAQPKHMTTTKGQEALEALIGSFDVWKRTHVLTAADLGAFTMARDADRKRLLELLLGVDDLDAAGDRARFAHGNATKDAAVHESRARGARMQVERLAAELRRAQEGTGERPPAPRGNPEELREALRQAKDVLNNAEQEYSEAAEYVEHARDTLRGARERLQGIDRELSERACARCGATTPTERIEALRFDREAELAAVEHGELELPGIEDAYTSALARVHRLRVAVQTAQHELDAYAREEAAHAAVSRVSAAHVDRLSTQLGIAEEELDDAELDLARAHREELIAKHAAHVLSTHGVRAHLMRGVMTGIEDVANSWLARIAGPDVRLEIGLRDSARADVTLGITGLGAGRTYRGCSMGQRRRVDVALLFALAEIAAGASGRAEGTLWCDEVFDLLDDNGKASVAEAIDEQAKHRAVVVITHDDGLEHAFRNVAARVHVHEGRIEVR